MKMQGPNRQVPVTQLLIVSVAHIVNWVLSGRLYKLREEDTSIGLLKY